MKIKFFIILLGYSLTIGIIGLSLVCDSKSLEDWNYVKWTIFLLFLPLLLKHSLNVICSPFYHVYNRKTLKSLGSFYPKVSVIIPAWNEEIGIADSMESVLESDYPDLELIVVNDGSTDDTDKVIKRFLESHQNRNISYISQKNGGKASALNTGLKVAKGELVVTTDADSFVDKQAIKNLVAYFDTADVMGVAGNVRTGFNGRLTGYFQQLEYLYGFYFKRCDSMFNAVYIIGGAAAAYRREIFDKLGGFDENIITEDIEYSTRILDAGYQTRYAADALFYTECPVDITSLIKQRLRWKYGRFKTFFKYRDLFFSVQKKHNKFLTFLVFPTALFSDFLLFLGIILLPTFFFYTFYTLNFTPLSVVIVFMALLVNFEIMTDCKSQDYTKLFFFTPIAWLIFYFIDFIEYMALLKSLNKFFNKQEVVWQTWRRTGVLKKSGSKAF